MRAIRALEHHEGHIEPPHGGVEGDRVDMNVVIGIHICLIDVGYWPAL